MKNQNKINLKMIDKLKSLERENILLKETLKFYDSLLHLKDSFDKYDNVHYDIDFKIDF